MVNMYEELNENFRHRAAVINRQSFFDEYNATNVANERLGT